MFTGIIETRGRIDAIERASGEARLAIDALALDLGDVALGDSIAVAGVCLTVVAVDGAMFAADVSAETLARTTLGTLTPGHAVNLEKSLRLADRLGGHLVSGHVDGVGHVERIDTGANAQRWTFSAPTALLRYIAEKGSIAVDGASLTVNAVSGDCFDVTLIPHTLARTTFGALRIGAAVNLEVDLVARYVERLRSFDDVKASP